jgi:hypothetical protein
MAHEGYLEGLLTDLISFYPVSSLLWIGIRIGLLMGYLINIYILLLIISFLIFHLTNFLKSKINDRALRFFSILLFSASIPFIIVYLFNYQAGKPEFKNLIGFVEFISNGDFILKYLWDLFSFLMLSVFFFHLVNNNSMFYNFLKPFALNIFQGILMGCALLFYYIYDFLFGKPPAPIPGAKDGNLKFLFFDEDSSF